MFCKVLEDVLKKLCWVTVEEYRQKKNQNDEVEERLKNSFK